MFDRRTISELRFRRVDSPPTSIRRGLVGARIKRGAYVITELS
jgi:hypothetical protein